MNARFLRLPQHVWFWTGNSGYCCDVINGAAHPFTHAHLLPKQIPLLQFEELIVDQLRYVTNNNDKQQFIYKIQNKTDHTRDA